jgi:hypothetical protein
MYGDDPRRGQREAIGRLWDEFLAGGPVAAKMRP